MPKIHCSGIIANLNRVAGQHRSELLSWSEDSTTTVTCNLPIRLLPPQLPPQFRAPITLLSGRAKNAPVNVYKSAPLSDEDIYLSIKNLRQEVRSVEWNISAFDLVFHTQVPSRETIQRHCEDLLPPGVLHWIIAKRGKFSPAAGESNPKSTQ